MEDILLYILPSTNYFQEVCNIIKKYCSGCSDKTLIYVTINKPMNYLKEILKRINNNEVFFIDCISKSIGECNENDKYCSWLHGPQEITGLSIAIIKAVEKIPGEKILIIDSLSALLIYNDECIIAKFSNFILNKVRNKKVKTIILALDSDKDNKIIKIVGSFADKVITIM